MPGMEPAVESPTPLKCCWACCSMGMPPEYGVSRKIERATYEAVPFRFIAGNLHPDHDTLASFRRTFLPELKDLFVQVLLLPKAGGRAQRDVTHVVACRPHRCQERATATSTTLATRSRARQKNPTNAGFEQDYNAQVAVDQGSLLIVGCALSNHPNDSQEAEQTLSAMPSALGTPEAAALDTGYI